MNNRNELDALIERARNMVIVKVDTPPYRPITPYSKLVDTILELTAALKEVSARVDELEQARAAVRKEALEEACSYVCHMCEKGNTRLEFGKSLKYPNSWVHVLSDGVEKYEWFCVATNIRNLIEMLSAEADQGQGEEG